MKAILVLLATCLCAFGDSFNISNVFGSHMVLQRDRPAPVWGWSTVTGDKVSVSFNGNSYNTTCDATGYWIVSLPATPASLTAYTITAMSVGTGAFQTLTDILFGDVVFCSGQSNMEFTTNAAFNATAEIAAANDYPYIRVTSGPEQGSFDLNSVGNHTYNELMVTNLNWSIASNTSIGCPGCSGWNYFSAVCWFTIRDTFNALGGTVPIGGIAQSYGGTSIQWWSATAAIDACDAPPGSACCNYGGTDSCLWNSQVAPYTLGPMQLASVVFYQGEQNAGCGGVPQIDYYYCALPAMIADWRAKFNQPGLSFGVVLLAAWEANTPYFPELRLAQVAAAIHVPGVYAISALDRGDPAGGPVHSPYKQDVGQRSSWGLQATTYGAAVPYLGPRYTSSSTQTTAGLAAATIVFTPASLYGQTLVLNTSVACPSTITSDSCEAFAVLTSDCTWHSNVTATLSKSGTSLVLTYPTSLSIVATRGFFGNWPLVQLYNNFGIPAEPWAANVTGAVSPCPLFPPDSDYAMVDYSLVHA